MAWDDVKTDGRAIPLNADPLKYVTAADWNGLVTHVGGYVNVKDYGAVGDGVTDDTAAIQAALDAAAAAGGEVVVPRGVYLISDTLSILSYVLLRGEGEGSVLRLSLAAAAWQPTGTKAAVTMLGAVGAGLRDVLIDGQGAARTEDRKLSQVVVLAAAQRCVVERVVFWDVGQPTSSSSGSALLVVAQDQAGDWGDPGPLAVGAATDNVVRDCRFINPGPAKLAFAIRVSTNFSAKRPLSDYVNRAERNLIENCLFSGDWDWNIVELAGGGTVHNTVRGNHLTGHSLTAIDLDKGASYNAVEGNTVEALAKTAAYATDSAKRFSAIQDHGSGSDYLNVANIITRNTLRDIDGAGDTSTGTSAIGVEYATASQITHNIVEGVRNSGGGAFAVYLGAGSSGTLVEANALSGSKVGVYSSSVTTPASLRIAGNDVAASDSAVSLQPASGSIAGVVVSGNTLATSDPTKFVVSLGAQLSAPILDSNAINGGIDGVRVGSANAVLRGNVFRSAAGRSIRVGSTATLPLIMGNVSISPALGDMVIESGADAPSLVGNQFRGGQWAQGPRIMFGSAAPTAGAYMSGDVVWNTAPAAGAPPGWMCTTAGSPGTWKAMANLAA
jgi:hypothetical protein